MQEEFSMTMMTAAVSALSMMAAGTFFSVMVSASLTFLVMMRTDSIRIIAETSL